MVIASAGLGDTYGSGNSGRGRPVTGPAISEESAALAAAKAALAKALAEAERARIDAEAEIARLTGKLERQAAMLDKLAYVNEELERNGPISGRPGRRCRRPCRTEGPGRASASSPPR